MLIKTSTDLERKIFMAVSILDYASVSEVLHQFPIEKPDTKLYDFEFGKKAVIHFLYAIVIEICIKVIWEIEKNTPPKPTHDIFTRYTELSPESQQAISDIYDIQVSKTHELISRYKIEKEIKLQSLEDALRANEQTMRDIKYDGKFNGKSSALGSVMWNEDNLYMNITSNPDAITFPRSLLNYAISLHKNI